MEYISKLNLIKNVVDKVKLLWKAEKSQHKFEFVDICSNEILIIAILM